MENWLLKVGAQMRAPQNEGDEHGLPAAPVSCDFHDAADDEGGRRTQIQPVAFQSRGWLSPHQLISTLKNFYNDASQTLCGKNSSCFFPLFQYRGGFSQVKYN